MPECIRRLSSWRIRLKALRTLALLAASLLMVLGVIGALNNAGRVFLDPHPTSSWKYYHGANAGWQRQDFGKSLFQPALLGNARVWGKELYVIGEVEYAGGDAVGYVRAVDCISEIYVNDILILDEPDCERCVGCKGYRSWQAVDLSQILVAGRNRVAFKVSKDLNTGVGNSEFDWRWDYGQSQSALLASLSAAFAGAVLFASAFHSGFGLRAVTLCARACAAVRSNLPLILILLVSGILMLDGLESAVYKSPHNMVMSRETIKSSKMMLHLGFFATGFGIPGDNTSEGSFFSGAGGNRYYVHHPPMMWILVALGLMALTPFGFTVNGAATMVPTVFSLGTIALLYLFSKRLWGFNVAFFSSIVMCLTPEFRAYGQGVLMEPILAFSSMASLYSYLLWTQTRARRHLLLTYLSVIFGCLTGWAGYFIIPLLIAHHLMFQREKSIGFVASLIAIAIILFSAFCVQIYLLLGEFAYTDLATAFKYRSSQDRSPGISYPEALLTTEIRRMGTVATPYAVWGCGLFLLHTAYLILKRRDVSREAYVILLILLAFSYNAAWPNGAAIHMFWSFFYVLGLPLAAVAGLDSLSGPKRQRLKFAAYTVLVALWWLKKYDINW